MPETFQFYCPACGTPLSLPEMASGQQGPCPRCTQEIVAPDLKSGAPARRLTAIPEDTHKAMAPPVNRRAAPPVLPHSETPWRPEYRKPERKVSLTGAIFCCLVVAAGAFLAGHVYGKKSVKPPAGIMLSPAKPASKPSIPPANAPESAETPVKPDVTTAP